MMDTVVVSDVAKEAELNVSKNLVEPHVPRRVDLKTIGRDVLKRVDLKTITTDVPRRGDLNTIATDVPRRVDLKTIATDAPRRVDLKTIAIEATPLEVQNTENGNSKSNNVLKSSNGRIVPMQIRSKNGRIVPIQIGINRENKKQNLWECNAEELGNILGLCRPIQAQQIKEKLKRKLTEVPERKMGIERNNTCRLSMVIQGLQERRLNKKKMKQDKILF